MRHTPDTARPSARQAMCPAVGERWGGRLTFLAIGALAYPAGSLLGLLLHRWNLHRFPASPTTTDRSHTR